MVKINPFVGIRPQTELAAAVAALPYDVMNRAEAAAMADGNPHSILHITRAEIDCDPTVGDHDDGVYVKAKENLQRFFDEGILLREDKPVYYIYREVMDGRTQTGLVAAASVKDYRENIIKKHELTRKDKEEDRIRHFKTLGYQTEPVFLTYKQNTRATEAMATWATETPPQYDFTSPDGVKHSLWCVDDAETIAAITRSFEALDALYIADGHHRTASAAAVSRGDDGIVMAVIFPAEELTIMSYNRLVKDKNGLSSEQILAKLEAAGFQVEVDVAAREVTAPHKYLMILDGRWYGLTAAPALYRDADVVESLDAAVLQNHVLAPIFGIHDPRTDARIDFIGGIRGSGEVAKRSVDESGVGFTLCPVSMQEIMDIADQGKIMFPKSTWFEPKLQSGLFLCQLR